MFQTDNHFFQTVTEGITDGNRSTKIQYRVCWIESTNTGYDTKIQYRVCWIESTNTGYVHDEADTRKEWRYFSCGYGSEIEAQTH